MASLAQINIRFSADLRQFSSEMQTVLRTVGRTGERIQALGRGMSTYLTLPLVAAGAASIKFASDYNESLNKAEVAFGDAAGGVKDFAKTTLESFGIAEGTALDLAAAFGDMGTSLGLSQAQAARMSTSLVGLAGDLASFKNIAISEAQTALSGIFTGETESLKRLGIVMTETNLAAFALSQGINKQFKDFTQAEKVQLRYAYIMSVTKNSQGDFARTSDQAANQMRIFQESLKETAANFGSILLPYFTKAITVINDIIKGFVNMDQGTKVVVVGIAAIVAAIGPLLTVLGSVMTLIPNLIGKFAELRAAAASLYATLLANPVTALVIGITALTAGMLIAGSRMTSLTNSTAELAEVQEKAAEGIAREKAELEKLLSIAKDERLSKEQRQKAIDELNRIVPEYNNGLTIETINSDKATKATNAHVEALLKKGKALAAQDKLVEIEKKLLELQLGNLKSVQPSVWQSLGNAFKTAAAGAAGYKEQSIAENLKEETAELLKTRAALQAIIGPTLEVAAGNDLAAETIKELSSDVAKFRVGSVDYYESLIKALEKTRDANAVTRDGYRAIQKEIDAIQEKIDRLNGTKMDLKKPIVTPDFEADAPALDLPKTLEYYDMEISRLQELQQTVATTSDQYKRLQDTINALEFEKIKIELDTSGLELSKENLKNIVDFFESEAERSKEKQQAIAKASADAFADISGNFIDSMGLAENGLQGFVKGIMKTVVKLISILLAESMANAISGATAAGTATGPAAVVTTPTFIATAVSGILAAFAAIPKFETGGIVGGNSFYGDRILARLNSRELVLNTDQQRKVFGMMNTDAAGSAPLDVSGELTVRGEDLVLVYDRAQNRKNRLG